MALFKWLSFTLLGAPPLNGVPATRFIAGVNWSLPYEWYFYLALPLLALTARIRVGLPYLLLGVAGIMIAKLYGAKLYLVSVFLGGIVAALAVRLPALTQFAKTRVASATALACIAALVVLFPSGYAYPQLFLLTVAFTLIVCGSDIFGLLSSAPSRILGELSYSLYLLHGMLLYVVTKYVIGYDPIRHISPFTYWSVVFCLVPLLLIIATITFHKVEIPGMQLTSSIVGSLRNQELSHILRFFNDPLADQDNDVDKPIF